MSDNNDKLDPSTPALKFDQGKPAFDLLPWSALREVAQVMGYGADKYSCLPVSTIVESHLCQHPIVRERAPNVKSATSTQGVNVDLVMIDGLKVKIRNTCVDRDSIQVSGTKLIRIILGNMAKTEEEILRFAEDIENLPVVNGSVNLVCPAIPHNVYWNCKTVPADAVEEISTKLARYIWTMTIQQGSLADIYVVAATTDSECLAMILRVLSERYPTYGTLLIPNLSLTKHGLALKGQGRHNWRKGFDYSRLYGAAFRHLVESIEGVDKDPETQLDHLAHACCCILFLLEHKQKGYGNDDRIRPTQNSPRSNTTDTNHTVY